MANDIHPTALIGRGVVLGENNRIGAYCVLEGPLEIGDDNWFGPHVVIGTPGQDTRDPRYDASKCPIRIGSRNIIREFTAVQKPCYGPLTTIGNDVHIMQSVHVPHDATIEDHVVITPMVSLGGLVRIMEGANLAMGCTVHQRSVVGAYAIVGTNAPVVKNVRPFSKYVPGRAPSVNLYAVEKFGFGEQLDEITAWLLDGRRPDTDRVKRVVERFEDLHAASGRSVYV